MKIIFASQEDETDDDTVGGESLALQPPCDLLCQAVTVIFVLYFQNICTVLSVPYKSICELFQKYLYVFSYYLYSICILFASSLAGRSLSGVD